MFAIVAYEPVKPGRLTARVQVRFCGFDEAEVGQGVAIADFGLPSVGDESRDGETLHRPEHPEPDPHRLQPRVHADRRDVSGQEGSFGQGHQSLHDVGLAGSGPRDDTFDLPRVERAFEDAEVVEGPLIGGRQQVVAPLDRALERSLAGGSVARPRPGQRGPARRVGRGWRPSAAPRPGPRRVRSRAAGRRAARRPRRRSAHRPGFPARPDGACAIDEESGRCIGRIAGRGRRAVHGERTDCVLLLAREVERGSAGDDEARTGRRTKQRGDVARGVDDLLEVVEDQQHRPPGQESRQGVRRLTLDPVEQARATGRSPSRPPSDRRRPRGPRTTRHPEPRWHDLEPVRRRGSSCRCHPDRSGSPGATRQEVREARPSPRTGRRSWSAGPGGSRQRSPRSVAVGIAVRRPGTSTWNRCSGVGISLSTCRPRSVTENAAPISGATSAAVVPEMMIWPPWPTAATRAARPASIPP